MSNARPSIVVEPLATDQNGNPVLPKREEPNPGSQTETLTSIKIPDDAEVDAKFKGKSLADVIQMVQNGDRKIGEMGAELGTWRKLVADLSPAQGQADQQVQSQPKPDETPLELTADDLLENPGAAISSVVERAISKALGPLEQELAQNSHAQEVAQLNRDYPEMAELGQDEAFHQWATSSPARAADATAAQQGDAAAARRLLENWRERNELVAALKNTQNDDDNQQQPNKSQEQQEADKPQGLDGAQQAVTERGGQGGPPPGQHLTAAEIQDCIINNPEKYRSPEYQAKVAEAAKAGALKLNTPDKEGHFVR